MQKIEVGPSGRENARSRSIKPLKNSSFVAFLFEMDYTGASFGKGTVIQELRYFVPGFFFSQTQTQSLDCPLSISYGIHETL